MHLFPLNRVKVCYMTFVVFFNLAATGYTQIFAVRIGISKTSPNYINWLKRSDSTAIPVNLYTFSIDSSILVLNDCQALLLTGGEDVYPGFYGKESDTSRCTGINRHRDTLELALIARALDLKIPIFAVCRGQQILNVALGGKLIIDIPGDFNTTICHQCSDYLHCLHKVNVMANSLLAEISGCDSAIVTTNHHQAVEILSPLLCANAHSPDGLIEGVEWKDPAGRSFLMGVQWHPERMEKSNPLSGSLADEFIRQAKLFTHPPTKY